MESVKEPYCEWLRAEGVLSLDRVESPWTVVPDLPRYNRRAFNLIEHDLRILNAACANGQRPDSRGILVLGEAGTGKTHLLMRVASNLSQKNPLLFIRRPTNEEAVGPHIWENILESLSQKLGSEGSNQCQLDVLLARIFARILIEAYEAELTENRENEQKQRMIEALRADPSPIVSLLGQGEGRPANLNSFRRKILNHLGAFCPHADQTIARVLITYCLVGAENKKLILRKWLGGHEIDEAEARELGLTRAAVVDDGTTSQASLHQARERFSLKCIQTLGELSTYHAPLILAFDQLEGLRHHSPALTHRFGDTVRELFTMAPNFLIVTCVFPSCWSEWFEQQLDKSAAQRIAQSRVELEAFAPEHGEQLLAKHLDAWFSKFSLPTSLYPFTRADVRELCARATSVREFLQAARTRYLDWLDDERCTESEPRSLNDASGIITSSEINGAIWEQLRKNSRDNFNTYTTRLPSEQALFGKLREVVLALLGDSKFAESMVQNAKRVLPAHVRIDFNCLDSDIRRPRSVVLVVCNANGVSFTARVRNLLSALKEEGPIPMVILVRDERSTATTPSMQTVIDEVSAAGGKLVMLNRESFSDLMALHDCLVAAEEGDLTAKTTTINKDKLLPRIRALAATPQFQLLQLIATEAGAELSASPYLAPSEVSEFNPAQATAAIVPLAVIEPPAEAVSECVEAAPETPTLPEAATATVLLGYDKQIGRDVEWEVSIRANPHLMVVGLPGMGKTTSLISICSQLADQGITPIVFSYHEDIDAALEERLGQVNRIDHSSLGFNPLRLDSQQARAHIDSAGRMRDIFASIFPDLGDVQTNLIREAIKESYEKSFSRSAASGPRFRDFFQILQQQPKPDKGLMARLTELDDYGLFSGSSENDNLLDTTTPSVVSLHCTQNEVVQRAFASLLFYRMYQEMFRRGLQQRITHAIVFDEAHRASRLKLLVNMGKEGRKYGVSLILASQEARDFSLSMYSAVANYLVLRVTDQDAKALAKNAPSSKPARQIADEMKQLPKHQAIFFQEGRKPSKIRLFANVKEPAAMLR